jgi:hypothetical protein
VPSSTTIAYPLLALTDSAGKARIITFAWLIRHALFRGS